MTRSTPTGPRSALALLAAAAGLALAASPAHAWLGSFAPADGYNINVFTGSANWSDVSYYNAGSYGANAGGGPGPTNIAPDSGKWKLVSQAGGFFPTTAARAAAMSGSPPYPSTVPAGTQPIYLIGDHFGGRTDNSALAFRNDTAQGSTGPAVYDYAMDTYDTGGPAPASVTGGTVSYGVYFETSPADAPVAGVRSADRFTQSILDSSGNIGAQWGYARDNEVTWRASASGPWTYTGIHATGGYDRMSFDIDLTADTFKLTYTSSASVSTVLAAGVPLGVAMNNFTGLRWQLEDGTNGGIGGKNFFDDASFAIPAPSSLALLGVGAAALRRRRA